MVGLYRGGKVATAGQAGGLYTTEHLCSVIKFAKSKRTGIASPFRLIGNLATGR